MDQIPQSELLLNRIPEPEKAREFLRLQKKANFLNPKSRGAQSLIEAVVKDENGNPIELSPFHSAWHTFIDDCLKKDIRRIGILAPRGTGKSVQISIGRTLWEIYKNPQTRIKIVCNSNTNAKLRVTALKSYIESDRDYIECAGRRVRPSDLDQWTQNAFVVKRVSLSIDPTVEARGILTAGVGGRADILLCDDICDLKNSLESKTLRKKVKDNFDNQWMPTVAPETGIVIYIATPWSELDLTHELLTKPGWAWLLQRVREDQSGFEEISYYNAA